ncbi:MAG TPA: hypothetical protein VKZ63_18255 [Kofleriaceae bacterium]|nr:hypothetical protein [Kofleriaceae bacterium]
MGSERLRGRAARRAASAAPAALASVVALAVATGCGSDDPPGKTYYERQIEPILIGSCAGNTGGCHAVDPADPFAFAAGNLDVTSFENVQRRRDLLQPHGAYGVPLLLVKAVGQTDQLGITYRGSFRPLEVQHAGGGILAVGSEAYLTLLEWTENGATENGLPPPAAPEEGQGGCSTFVPEEFDEEPITSHEAFGEFESEVQPILASCNAGSCHGAPQADFYVTCGDSTRQVAFNFSQAQAFVDDPVDNSQILQAPLDPQGGGSFHSGGVHFSSRDDTRYLAVAAWAEKVGPVEFGAGDPGKEFFAENVQPLLLTRGCSFQACHSPAATNDFQLRSGSQGFFSAIALERNYHKMRDLFMALEVPDARRGRAVAKTILETFGGIAHRGGPVLETPGSGGAQPSTCDDPLDPATASAYCIVQEWVNIERQQLIAAGQVLPLGEGDQVPVVYVARDPGHVASPLEFDTYQPGSDLRVSLADIGPGGSLVTPIPAGTSLLAGCPGAGDLGAVDVRSPDVNRDGNRVTFAMRTSASSPLRVYVVELDGSGCTAVTPDEGEVDGILIHSFDPAWSPDGEWIVYASTRGAQGGSPAPTVSRRLFLPQSDIWRIRPDGSGAQRMTYLSNSEISPQFMREGRVIMTTEKVSEGFYQLSGRRMNWDLTDYHPLLAQRAVSPFADPDDPDATRPSVDYQQATEIREGYDGNFLMVLSDAGARGGAGTVAIFNRSVGTFEAGRDDPGFLASMVIPDRAATGRVGEATDGAYRSPFPLLDGRILASYADVQADLGTVGSLPFALVALDPLTGDRQVVLSSPGEALVEAVLALKYPARELYRNRRQLVFGGRSDAALAGDGQAVIHFPDAPLIFTLLNANLRRGRPVDLFRGATQIAIYSEGAAPSGTTSGNLGEIYQDRELLGTARLADDGSAKVRVPAGQGVILELQDGSGNPIVTMREEHQLGPGEVITFGIVEPLFDAVCGGCHGTVSGREIEVFVTPDALTGASRSLSVDADPQAIAP